MPRHVARAAGDAADEHPDGDDTLSSMTLNGNSVASVKETIKGIEHAIVQVAASSYQTTDTP